MAHEMGNAITAGLERRPQYRKNADALFLKGPYLQVLEAIKAKDLALFKQRIEALRAGCTACHTAEAHPFIKIGVPTVRRNPVVTESGAPPHPALSPSRGRGREQGLVGQDHAVDHVDHAVGLELARASVAAGAPRSGFTLSYGGGGGGGSTWSGSS
jgi:hypothetical protein